MNSNASKNHSRTFLLIIALSIAGFLLWLLLVWLAQRSLVRIGYSVDYLAMLLSLSSALAAATVLSAAFIAYRELDELASSRTLDVADRLFAELNAPESIAARRFVYLELDPDPATGLANLDEAGQNQVKRVLNSLDRVAFLTQPDWIDESRVMPWLNPMVVKSWDKLGPYVIYERQRRNEPDYYEMAEGLAQRCIQWRLQNVGKAESKTVDHAL